MQVTIDQIKQRLKILNEPKCSVQGLTLIECLVAIVVLSAVIISMTPPIFLAVATRAQNRKAEQALQIAHGEIDKVRVLVEKGSFNFDQLPYSVGTTQDVTTVAAPTSLYGGGAYLESSNSTCSTFDTLVNNAASAGNPIVVAYNQAVPVDVNGNCQPAFFVQTFRNQLNGTTTTGPDTNKVSIAFTMGVRVYSYEAATHFGSLKTQQASLQLATGLGDQQTQPLAVLYNDISQSDQNVSLDKYRCFKANNCSP